MYKSDVVVSSVLSIILMIGIAMLCLLLPMVTKVILFVLLMIYIGFTTVILFIICRNFADWLLEKAYGMFKKE